MYALQPGEPVLLFDADAAAAPVNSDAYAMATDHVKYIAWGFSFASAPSACSIKIQVSDDNSIWTDLDSSTTVGGETKTTNPTAARFIRAQKASQTGGGALTLRTTLSYH